MAAIRYVVAICVCVGVFSSALRSEQDQTDKRTLTIRAVGAFLGQVEGFCEDPGGYYDWGQAAVEDCGKNGVTPSKWLGGILGVRKALGAVTPAGESLVLVAGNNQTPRFGQLLFWSELDALKADVVAMGPEDLLRSIRGPSGSAQRLVEWLASARRIPLMASNAAIRRTGDDLNYLEFRGDGFDIHFDEDQTVSWIGTIKIEHPAGASAAADLQEFDHQPAPREQGREVRAVFKPGEGGADGTVTFPQGLRPNRWYRLLIVANGFAKASVVFQSDGALTPFEKNVERLNMFPARMKTDDSVLIVSLIDPDTHEEAGSRTWTWEAGGVEHELILLDPKKTLQALRERAVVSYNPKDKDDKRSPPIVLMSTLADGQTRDLLEDFPDVRVVVLAPESAVIGRASLKATRKLPDGQGTRQDTRFSGDLGFAAVVDKQYPGATKMFLRPEWFGETLLTLEAKLQAAGDRWDVTDPNIKVDVVAGAPLEPKVDGRQVTYSAKTGATSLPIETQDLYLDCPVGATGDCRTYAEMWEKTSELAGMLGDALRSSTKADLAVISLDVLDEDYQAWVGREIKVQGGRWISRYVIDRLLYRSPAMVKAFVPGSKLAEVLQKIVKHDPRHCISGLQAACPTSVPEDHPERLRVNGRAINANLIYAIAVADAVAEELDLEHDDDEARIDVVDATDEYLRRGEWTRAVGSGPLASRLEERRSRRWEGYIAIPTLDLGLAGIVPRDPPGSGGVRRNLGVEFSGAKRTTTISATVETDIAIVDQPGFAIRVPASVRLKERRQPGSREYQEDAFAVGVRGEVKAGLLRPYAGLFWDGQILKHSEELTASREVEDGAREGFAVTESADFPTAYDTHPRRFYQLAGGLDLVHIPKWTPFGPRLSIAVKRFGAQYGFGTEVNVPLGITVGDQPFTIDEFLSEGDQALLNRHFKEHHATFTKDTAFTVRYGEAKQRRAEVNLDTDLKLKAFGDTYSATWKARYRYFDTSGADKSGLLLSSATRSEFKLTMPLFWRFEFKPTYVYQRATIERADNDVFTNHQFELNLSLPLMARWRRGSFIH